MTEEKRAPEQDASEGDRATIERELRRAPGNDNGDGSNEKPDAPRDGSRRGDKIAVATTPEPGDHAQSMPPSL